MEPVIPTCEDHCRIQILVKSIGYRSTATFNRLLERLNRVEVIQISDNPKRMILAKFVTSWNPALTKFGEFQAFRKIFGFIGVAYSSQSHQTSSSSSDQNLRASLERQENQQDLISVKSMDLGRSRRYSSILGANSRDCLELLKEQYDSIKDELKDQLVDSRMALFGFSKSDEIFDLREVLTYSSLKDSEEFENHVHELIRSIYIVLESRRLDLSYERMEVPPCPTLQEEEKYRIGLENKQSKLYKMPLNYRKKCIGRLRKQVADYTLLTGLPTLALDAYSAAIECLKATSDFLWLAAAYEGWGCSAVALKYNETEERLRKQSGLHRVSSMTLGQMGNFQAKDTQHKLDVSIGHQRSCSDNDQLRMAYTAAAAARLTEQSKTPNRTPFKNSLGKFLTLDWNPTSRSPLDHEEIVDRFKTMLENYEKYSFAAMIEYEGMIRAASVFKYQKLPVETHTFLREHAGKFLDDSFTVFNSIMKAQICISCASIYKEIGFRRKNAFFSRLAVLFRLHVSDNEIRTETDYRLAYPILYKTLAGYGINDSNKDAPRNGPIAVQVKALHEVFMSALRAKYYDAAIRHLCYILQVYYEYMDGSASLKMIEELQRLVSDLPHMHCLAQHIALDNCGIILPPLQMTRFPMCRNFKIVPLPDHLAPTVIQPNKAASVFIYSPFDKEAPKDTYWVANCACEVSAQAINMLPLELTIKNLTLLTEGCAYESIPVLLNLPPCRETPEPAIIKILGVPRSPGKLTITGYSCEVFGVKNVCTINEPEKNVSVVVVREQEVREANEADV